MEEYPKGGHILLNNPKGGHILLNINFSAEVKDFCVLQNPPFSLKEATHKDHVASF